MYTYVAESNGIRSTPVRLTIRNELAHITVVTPPSNGASSVWPVGTLLQTAPVLLLQTAED